MLLLLLLSHFSCVRLCDPIDGSQPGSPIAGILQARTLEWVAISFSNAWKWKVKVKSLSRVWLLATPWTAAYQAPPPMGFSRQENWSGVPLPSPLNCNNRIIIIIILVASFSVCSFLLLFIPSFCKSYLDSGSSSWIIGASWILCLFSFLFTSI